MLNQIIEKLIDKKDLSPEDILLASKAIHDGGHPFQVAAILVLLRSKGETSEEIASFAKSMQVNTLAVRTKIPVLDIVGTGGDRSNTINISTGSAILAAACGIPVAKHGNRSISSRCGSADVLEALGVAIDLSPAMVARSIEKIGIGFMFAPRFNPALASLATVRKALKVPTIFNVLGSLLNPAKADFLLYGVNRPELVGMLGEALQKMGVVRALVFHGNGTDELTAIGPTRVLEVTKEKMREFAVDPHDYGMSYCRLQDLQGGSSEENALLLREVFLGKQGALADTLALNAGASLWIYGLVTTIAEGVQMAFEALKRGDASRLLDQWIQLTHELKEHGDEKYA